MTYTRSDSASVGDRHHLEDGTSYPVEQRDARRQPFVYILLVNWQGWADTIECLESVFRLRYERFRVVVCDNASSNQSLDHIRAWAEGRDGWRPPARQPFWSSIPQPLPKPISCVQYSRLEAEAGGDPDDQSDLILIQTGANLGFAGGNNVAIRFAMVQKDVDYLWLLNNDTVVEPQSLQAQAELADGDPTIGMVGAKLLEYGRPSVIQAVAGGYVSSWRGMASHLGSGEEDEGQWSMPIEVDCIIGASLLVKALTVGDVGVLDERYFMYSEEMDWCVRTKRKGWRLVYSPGSTVWHKEGQSVGQKSALQDYYAVRSTLLMVRKLFPRLLPFTMVYLMYRCLLPKALRIQPTRFAAVVRAYRDFLQMASRGP